MTPPWPGVPSSACGPYGQSGPSHQGLVPGGNATALSESRNTHRCAHTKLTYKTNININRFAEPELIAVLLVATVKNIS